MEDLTYFDVVKKLIREREKQISETLMSGALESIEHYKFLQGELNALYYIEGELKELNKEKNSMAKSETVLDAYVDQDERVLDPTILEQSALDRAATDRLENACATLRW